MSLKTMVLGAVPLFFAFLCIDAAAGKVIKDSYQSTVLGRKVEFTVYLPDEYNKTAGKLPAVYLLHGLDGDQNAGPGVLSPAGRWEAMAHSTWR